MTGVIRRCSMSLMIAKDAPMLLRKLASNTFVSITIRIERAIALVAI